MSSISITKLYSLLTDKVGKETAENLTTFIEEKIHDEVENQTKVLATREDLIATRDDLTKEISKLDFKINDCKSDIIKWMFIFWTGQAVTTFGFILLFLKK